MLKNPRLEFNVVEHCNLRCVECSHFSPWMPRKFADLESFRRDLQALKPAIRFDSVRFVGGEPLLHPDLDAFIAAVRASGLAPVVTIVTNGTEILKRPDAFFRSIDRLELSQYPDTPTDAEKVEYARRKCSELSIQFQLLDKPKFRSMQLDRANPDGALVGRIYFGCGIAHIFKCHVIRDGWYYKCSRPLFTGEYLARKGLPGIDLSRIDGVAIHEPALESRLKAYIEDPKPLESCKYCLGSAGKAVTHRQLPADELHSAVPDARKPQDLVDFELLSHIESARRTEQAALRSTGDPALAGFMARLVGGKPPPRKDLNPPR